MARVVKRITFGSRGVSFEGTAVFASMGKWVTDWLGKFRGPGWIITDVTADTEDTEKTQADAHELACVVEVLDAAGVPKEMAPGTPYSVHGRIAAALEGRAK